MPWKTKLNDAPKYIEITYSGNVTTQELYMALENSVLISRENNINLFLADCTTMLGGHTVIDLYGLISMFETLKIDSEAKEAVIMTSLHETADEINFYETACKNRGFNVRIFKQREEAISWLVS
jgi:hypothetical protein